MIYKLLLILFLISPVKAIEYRLDVPPDIPITPDQSIKNYITEETCVSDAFIIYNVAYAKFILKYTFELHTKDLLKHYSQDELTARKINGARLWIDEIEKTHKEELQDDPYTYAKLYYVNCMIENNLMSPAVDIPKVPHKHKKFI